MPVVPPFRPEYEMIGQRQLEIPVEVLDQAQSHINALDPLATMSSYLQNSHRLITELRVRGVTRDTRIVTREGLLFPVPVVGEIQRPQNVAPASFVVSKRYLDQSLDLRRRHKLSVAGYATRTLMSMNSILSLQPGNPIQLINLPSPACRAVLAYSLRA